MIQLTVGYVAGIVAAALFIAGVWSPNTLAFILSGLLRDRNSAATWTVASRALQSSYWPDLLRTDSVRTHGVRKDIVLLTHFGTLMGVLITVAGVVTPLGLYEALVPSSKEQTRFSYLEDATAIGLGTPARTNYSFNRLCVDKNQSYYTTCPFSNTVVTLTPHKDSFNLSYPYGYNITIPQVLTDIYSSGTNDNTTISSFFDIQWRRYRLTRDQSYEHINNESAYLVSSFRDLQTLALNNAIEPVEGLVVDTVSGGIGLRNHTVPRGFQHGVTWREDLLFLEPETVCVDTNLTVDFTVALTPNAGFGTEGTIVDQIWLTDRGGFVNINHTFPLFDTSDTQSNADLLGRAYKAAWLNNVNTMLYFNVTTDNNATLGLKAFSYLNSTIDKTFTLPLQSDGLSDPTFLKMTSSFGDYLNLDIIGNRSKVRNPFGITADSFTAANLLCAGANSDDIANITNIYVACGLMRGVPQRVDGGNQLNFDSQSRWSQPLHACASAVKATVKTVSFNYNGTQGVLSDLSVDDIEPKTYPNQSSMPLWGVENYGNTMGQGNLIWGLLSSSYEGHPNVSTVRQDHLYLPGYSIAEAPSGAGYFATGFENLPGADFFSGAMSNAYAVPAASAGLVTDYSGQVNMAMWAYWQSLSKSASTASLIPNLIFTDTAAAAVVGTKGVLGPGNAAGENLVTILVTPTVMRIRYHWPFAIPALIVAAALLIMTVFALATLALKRHNFSMMRRRLNHVSPGRIYTSMLYSEQKSVHGTTKEWSREMGKRTVDLGGAYPTGDNISTPAEKGSAAIDDEQGASDEQNMEGEGFLLRAVKHPGGHGGESERKTIQRSCRNCGAAITSPLCTQCSTLA